MMNNKHNTLLAMHQMYQHFVLNLRRQVLIRALMLANSN
jgi:hypothetical protein